MVMGCWGVGEGWQGLVGGGGRGQRGLYVGDLSKDCMKAPMVLLPVQVSLMTNKVDLF